MLSNVAASLLTVKCNLKALLQHQPHFRCTIAPCDEWLPHRTSQIKSIFVIAGSSGGHCWPGCFDPSKPALSPGPPFQIMAPPSTSFLNQTSRRQPWFLSLPSAPYQLHLVYWISETHPTSVHFSLTPVFPGWATVLCLLHQCVLDNLPASGLASTTPPPHAARVVFKECSPVLWLKTLQWILIKCRISLSCLRLSLHDTKY